MAKSNSSPAAARRKRRTYNSALRELHGEQTRRRVLDAAIAAMVDEGAKVSLRDVAARAGVSAPTVYRYFPTPEALLEAVVEEFEARTRAVYPRSWSELDALTRRLFVNFAETAELTRAYLTLPPSHPVRAAGRRKRARYVSGFLARNAPGLDAHRRRALGALVTILMSINTWEHFTDWWGIPAEEGGRIVAWAVATLHEAMSRSEGAAARPGGVGGDEDER